MYRYIYIYITLSLSLRVPRWASHNTDLPSDRNLSKTVRLSIAFAGIFFKEYSTTFLMVCRLIDSALVCTLHQVIHVSSLGKYCLLKNCLFQFFHK